MVYTAFFYGNDEMPQEFESYDEAVEYANERCDWYGGTYEIEPHAGELV